MRNDLTTVDFHGAMLIAVRGATPAETLVAMKPVVEDMGLSWQGQHEKLLTHPVLSKGIRDILIPSAGGPQAMTALPLSRLNFWLATIQPNKVPDPVVRAKVIQYQEECADVLFEHFFAKAAGETLDAKTIGGIIKAVIGKQVPELVGQVARDLIQEQLPAIVGAAIATDPRRQALPYVTALEIASAEGVPARKRRGLVTRMSARLRRYCNSLEMCPLPDGRGVWMFPRQVVGPWLDHEGRALIQEHKAAVMGQGVLPFRSCRRPAHG